MSETSATPTPRPQPEPVYRRVLLKLSGEALMGSQPFGIDEPVVVKIADELRAVHALGVELAVVIGGGNIIRGLAASHRGIDRVTGDYMGMLATVINALALQDALEKRGVVTRVQTAIDIRDVASSPPTAPPRCGPTRSTPTPCSRRPRWTGSTPQTRTGIATPSFFLGSPTSRFSNGASG